MNPQTEYSTADIGRASYLLTRGCRLLRTEKLMGATQVRFIFEKKTAEKLNVDLLNNAPIGSLDFLNAMRSVKESLRDARSNGGDPC